MSSPDNLLGALLGRTDPRHEASVLSLLIQIGAQFVNAMEGSLLVLDRDSGELVFAMTVGDQTQEALIGQRVPVGSGITGLAAQTREVQIGAPTFGTDQAEEPKSVLAAPMLIKDELIGVLTAVSFDPDKRFTADDAVLYGRIATVAALVVQQRRQLASIEALRTGTDLPSPITEDERHNREILEVVKDLLRASPDVKGHVAVLLSAVAALVKE
ncbi:MAG: GAF domain-containing protein [Planctomycetota bacterium]|jgi:GAF domain-containing protein